MNYQGGNRLLDAFPDRFRTALLSRAALVNVTRDAHVVDAGSSIDVAYFPVDCIYSVIVELVDGTSVEVASTGREGVLDMTSILTGAPARHRVIAQIGGAAVRVDRDDFVQQFEESAEVRSVLERYMFATMTLAEQSVACNRRHSIVQRCSRWLLWTADRLGRDEFPLTQEYLAMMLGVRRAGVSIAAGTLQREGALKYARGNIALVDRMKLAGAACECYGVALSVYNLVATGV